MVRRIALSVVFTFSAAGLPAQGTPLFVAHVDFDAWRAGYPQSRLAQMLADPAVQPAWRSIVQMIEGNGGGAVTHVLTLARLLNPKDFAVTVAFFEDGPSVKLAVRLGLNARLILRRFDFDVTMAFRLSRLVREEKIDILHSHTITGNFYARWASLLIRRRPIIITTVHSFVIDEMKGGTQITFRDYLRYKREVWLSGMSDHFVAVSNRSEERRVGKECRSRWSPYH